jgi:ubiquinone/menaquinone biosynthesis C-methylase UbiE
MSIQGCVDRVSEKTVDGWAYREEDPSEHLVVAVQRMGSNIGSATANGFREDLKAANIGNGDHAYSIALELPIRNGELDSILVVASSRNGESQSLSVPAALSSADADFELGNGASGSFIRRYLERSLKYGVTYADSADLLPPVGYPADYIDDRILREYASWVQASPDEMRERIRRDPYPIPHPDNRERYADGNDLMYWLSGFVDYRMIQGLAEEYGVKGGRYFDFGGSTGRVFRHFSVQSDAWEVWSCDFKISSVEFNLRYFPSKIRVFLNTSFPTLPIPDSYFDLISACSVFTHIDESETGWLLGLWRVLKPGGIACISIHSKDTWKQMTADLRDYVVKFRPDIANDPVLPEGKTVVTFRSDDPYRCQTFHSDDYIHRNWGRFFEICEIRPMVLGEQAMVICRRRE